MLTAEITDCKFSAVNGMIVLSITDGAKWVDINVTDMAALMILRPADFDVRVLAPAKAALGNTKAA